MTSSPFAIDRKQAEAIKVFGIIGEALREGYETSRKRGATLGVIAERMGVNKSHVSRLLNGEANMTLRSLAHLAAAMDHTWEISLIDKHAIPTNGELDVYHPVAMTVNHYTTTTDKPSVKVRTDDAQKSFKRGHSSSNIGHAGKFVSSSSINVDAVDAA